MIVELGHFALILAAVVAAMQIWKKAAILATFLQSTLILFAFLALVKSYVTSDFSVLNVIQNSHSAKPLLYKIAGAWGNHEGSMLLWTLLLSLYGSALAVFSKNIPRNVLSIQGGICFLFLLFILFTSNPFLRVPLPPADGQDLNPLLQDPGLAFHPPLLYLGYVGFAVPFVFACAGLWEKKVDSAWARAVRPWALIAWTTLTLGIALGSWWAYYELGWGGWWFWDPVENASLLPWLSGTALLHSLRVVEKRESLKGWTVALCLITFGLCLVGTFLVRSGVITSVHAFALDPARGVFILLILAIVLGGAFTLFALRASTLQPRAVLSPISREGMMILNNLFLIAAAATLFLGTLYPLFVSVFGGSPISVGPPYFNITVIPLLLPVIFLMSLGPHFAWVRADILKILPHLKYAVLITIIVVSIILYIQGVKPILGWLALSVAVWSVATGIADIFRQNQIKGYFLAHLGLSIAVIGMTGSLWTAEKIVSLRAGEMLNLPPYTLTLKEDKVFPGPNYMAQQGRFDVYKGGHFITTLLPEKRWYPVAKMATTESAIHTDLSGNIYVALGDKNAAGAWTVRAWLHPLVAWIWGGALVMALGGVLCVVDRKKII